MPEIQLRNVTKQFSDSTRAVSEVNLTIHDGEFFILVGPSGCGKSTLLNMIAGLEEVSNGEISVGSRIINNLDPKDRNMAMVFQSYALYPHMSVRENIAFPLVMHKVAKDEIEKRVKETAAMLGLTHVLDSKPRNLSGGQRQRVAMGRAIVRKPVAFLFDEPLSNLDARLRNQMRIEIARLQRQLEATTVYVTHDQIEAMTLGDRIAVLKEGVVQQIGAPHELYEQPRNLFVAGFIGSPSMNFFPVQIRNNRLFFSFLNFETDIPQQTSFPERLEEAIAGIRPEHFHLLSNTNGRSKESVTLEVVVEVVEWLGAEVLIYFQTKLHNDSNMPVWMWDLMRHNKHDNTIEIAVRLNTTDIIKNGDRIQLTFDPQQIHFFDPYSGTCLTSI